MIDFSPINIRTWSRLGSCGAYGIAAMELPLLDDKMVACTADLCFYSGLDRFRKEYPDRIYNVGIAEQNLVGIAGGLAKEGYSPFASTYASFATTRALDQVRTNMGYMQLPIKLIGLTSGMSVGILGATHMSIEDVAIMRAIPNITVVAPADTTETVKATLALANYNKPVYLRLSGGMNSPVVYREDYDFEIGKAITLKQGKDIAIISYGAVVSNCIKASDVLQLEGFDCTVIDMHTIKPIDSECLEKIEKYKLIVVVEEHNLYGGLGSGISEYYAAKEKHPVIKTIGINDYYPHAAEYKYLITQNGLDENGIYTKVKQFIKEILK